MENIMEGVGRGGADPRMGCVSRKTWRGVFLLQLVSGVENVVVG